MRSKRRPASRPARPLALSRQTTNQSAKPQRLLLLPATAMRWRHFVATVATVTDAIKKTIEQCAKQGRLAATEAAPGFYGPGKVATTKRRNNAATRQRQCSQQRRVNYFRFTFLHFICSAPALSCASHLPPPARPFPAPLGHWVRCSLLASAVFHRRR